MRVAALLRVSTRHQAETGFSLPEQERAVREWAARTGHTVAEVVTDGGISGRLLERPGVLRVLELAREKAIEGVTLVTVDRAGRANRVIQEVCHRFREAGLTVTFSDLALNTDTKHGRLMVNMLGGVAEYVWEDLRERTMDGKAEKARSGRMPHMFAALGYDVIRRWQEHLPEYVGRSGEFVVNEPEAALVRTIYARYADEGQSLRELATWLREAGHRTKRGGTWRASALQVLLRNPLYLGQAAYHKSDTKQLTGQQTAGGKPKTRVTRRPPEQWTLIPCPPIIEPALWHRAQARLDRNRDERAGRPPQAPRSPLNGLVFCDACRGKRGQPLRCFLQINNRNSRRWTCSSTTRAELASCGTHYGDAEILRGAQRWALKLLKPGALAAMAKAHHERRQQQAGPVRARLTAAALELREVAAQEGRLADLVLAGLSPEAVAEKALQLAEKRRGLAAEVRRLEAQAVPRAGIEEALEAVERHASALREFLETDPARVYQALLTVHVAKGPPPSLRFEVRAEAYDR